MASRQHFRQGIGARALRGCLSQRARRSGQLPEMFGGNCPALGLRLPGRHCSFVFGHYDGSLFEARLCAGVQRVDCVARPAIARRPNCLSTGSVWPLVVEAPWRQNLIPAASGAAECARRRPRPPRRSNGGSETVKSLDYFLATKPLCRRPDGWRASLCQCGGHSPNFSGWNGFQDMPQFAAAPLNCSVQLFGDGFIHDFRNINAQFDRQFQLWLDFLFRPERPVIASLFHLSSTC